MLYRSSQDGSVKEGLKDMGSELKHSIKDVEADAKAKLDKVEQKI